MTVAWMECISGIKILILRFLSVGKQVFKYNNVKRFAKSQVIEKRDDNNICQLTSD